MRPITFMLDRFRYLAPILLIIVATACAHRTQDVVFKLIIDLPENSSFIDIDTQRAYREELDNYAKLEKNNDFIQMAIDGRPKAPIPVVLNENAYVQINGEMYELKQIKDNRITARMGDPIYLSNGHQNYKIAFAASGIIHVKMGVTGVVVTNQPSF